MPCASGQLLVSTLDGSFESAFLLNIDAAILHKNVPARTLFGAKGVDDGANEALSSFLAFSEPHGSWDSVVASLSTKSAAHRDATAFQKDGKAVPARVSLTKLAACPCCDVTYLCAYVHLGQPPNPENHELLNLKRMQDIVDASFDPMFSIDAAGTILLANDAATGLFGWTNEEFIGGNISMICGNEHAAKHGNYMQRYLKTGVTKIMGKKREVYGRRKDGSEVPLELGIKEIQGRPSSPGVTERFFCAFIRDLTEHKKYLMELELRASLTQGMVNSSFDPMFQIDERGIIQVVNQSAEALFGWERDELLGSNISIICGGEHREQHDQYLERYLSTGIKHVIGKKRVTTARRKDGTEVDVELGVQEVQSNTGERMFCGYVRDLTQQNLDKQRIRRNEALINEEFFGEDARGAGRRYRHSPTL